MFVDLKNEAGIVRHCKVGFSWTMLFFGIFVPLVRGDVKWFFMSLIISIFTCGLGWLVLPFLYNKAYIKGLLESGYKPATENDRNILVGQAIIASQIN